MISIREETASDAPAIRRLSEEAFGQPAEAALVDRLRSSRRTLLSLVAVMGGRVVGHILFSPVVLEPGGGERRGMGLGPMAVSPPLQRQGTAPSS